MCPRHTIIKKPPEGVAFLCLPIGDRALDRTELQRWLPLSRAHHVLFAGARLCMPLTDPMPNGACQVVMGRAQDVVDDCGGYRASRVWRAKSAFLV